MTQQEREQRIRQRQEERERQIRQRLTIFICALLALILLIVLIVTLSGRGKKAGNTTAGTGTDTSGQLQNGTAAGDAVTQESVTIETESETPAPETEAPDPYADKPDIDINSWEFILANPTHSINEYTPETAYYDTIELDVRIIDAFSRFIDAAKAQGLTVYLVSGYRSYATQSMVYQNKVAEYGGDEATAATIVAPPGTSEHQTGLAADVTDQYYQYMNSDLENTALYQWMSAHCQEYGFIVRFPKDRQDVTGIIYEPWHYRYVGVEAATYIMEHNLTLEEFLALYE